MKKKQKNQKQKTNDQFIGIKLYYFNVIWWVQINNIPVRQLAHTLRIEFGTGSSKRERELEKSLILATHEFDNGINT